MQQDISALFAHIFPVMKSLGVTKDTESQMASLEDFRDKLQISINTIRNQLKEFESKCHEAQNIDFDFEVDNLDLGWNDLFFCFYLIEVYLNEVSKLLGTKEQKLNQNSNETNFLIPTLEQLG